MTAIRPAFDVNAEAAAIERATGDQIRAALRPYLDHLREINPAGYAYLTRSLTAYGCDWLDAFREPARFGWRGKRWPAPLNAEIASVIADLGDIEAAAYRAHHGLTADRNPTEPS
jgi:hypothetical protein